MSLGGDGRGPYCRLGFDVLARKCQVRVVKFFDFFAQLAEVAIVHDNVIGSLQAVEAIKLILGVGEPLVGRLLAYDGLLGETRQLRTARDPECPACGDPGRPPALVDYDDTCTPG